MVFEKVQKVIADHLGIGEGEITITSKFQEDLGVDSLDIFEIAMELEDEFNLEISIILFNLSVFRTSSPRRLKIWISVSADVSVFNMK